MVALHPAEMHGRRIVVVSPHLDDGVLSLGASIQQRNSKADNAGWSLQTVEVNTIG